MLLGLCKAASDAVVVLKIQEAVRSHDKESFDIGRIRLFAGHELLVAFEERTNGRIILATNHTQII